MKKFTAILLCALTVLLCFTGCGGSADDVPEGMVLASLEGEPFRLYVPNQMTTNLQSGISSAYALVPERMVISARYYTPSDSEMTVDDYLRTYCVNAYSKTIEGFALENNEPEATVLAGADARRIRFSAKIDGIDYKCTQITALHKGDMVSLHFYVPAVSYDTYLKYCEQVISAFVLCDKTEPASDHKTDGDTPEGMKIASRDTLEYVLYVPSNWICNSESERVQAYYPESERSNVTLTSFLPNEIMDINGYMAFCEKSYGEDILGFEPVEDNTPIKLSGIDGMSMTFESVYDEVTFKTRQYCVKYGELFYTLTYTARAECFDAHLGDVEKMVENFKFR